MEYCSSPANSTGSPGHLVARGSDVAPGQARPIAPDGRTSLEIDLTEIPTPTGFIALAAGQTWNFQLWHRDANPSGTSNLTNGVQVMLQ